MKGHNAGGRVPTKGWPYKGLAAHNPGPNHPQVFTKPLIGFLNGDIVAQRHRAAKG